MRPTNLERSLPSTQSPKSPSELKTSCCNLRPSSRDTYEMLARLRLKASTSTIFFKMNSLSSCEEAEP